MLEILQARDYKKYSSIFDEIGFEDEIISVAEAVDNGNIIGFGIYHFDDEYVIVDYVDSNDDTDIFDGIVRSILFLAVNNNIDKAIFKIKETDKLHILGFTEQSENILNNIQTFLSNCKSCKK